VQSKYSTKNVPAGILYFVVFALSILLRWINYQSFSEMGDVSVSFISFTFSNPVTVIWLLGLIGIGVMLLAKFKPGVGGAFFVFAAVNVFWLIQDIQFVNTSVLYTIGGLVVIPILSAAAYIIAGIICIATEKVPRTTTFMAIPCILLFFCLAFEIVSYIPGITSVINGYGNTPGLFVMRVVLLIALYVCEALAVLFACQWAMSDVFPATNTTQNTYAYAPTTAHVAPNAASFTWFCPQCGQGNSGAFCTQCGTRIPERIAAQQQRSSQAFPASQQPAAQAMAGVQQQPAVAQPAVGGQPNPADTGSFGWAVLGFFVPLAGLILWIVWKTERPLSAKKAGIGALVSVLASVVLTIIEVAIIASMGSSMYY